MTVSRLRRVLKRNGLLLVGGWTAVIALMGTLTIRNIHSDTLRAAADEARDYHRLNLFYRAWAAKMGGVYVPPDKAAPNPYLSVPHRDLVTTDGRQLTLVNPAYMTRMVFESIAAASPDPIISKLTSLKPLNPLNKPDDWERQGLEGFERGEYVERSTVTTIDDRPYLRQITRFVVEPPCLKCHARQGYREGQIRGAITISVPLSKRLAQARESEGIILGGYTILWLCGTTGVVAASRRRWRDEAHLRENEQRFRTVCDWTQDWEYWISPDGTLRYVSPSCLEVTGYTREEFEADPQLIRRLVHPDQADLFDAHHRTIGSGGDAQAEVLEFRIVTRRGEERWIEHTCRPIFDGGVYLGRRASNRDITNQKRMAEERLNLERQLLQTQKMESLGVLAGGIAHDFNNILTAIVGHVDLALMRINRESPASENLRRIQDAANRAADLARQMLAYSGKGKFVIEDIDLNLLIQEMTHMLEVSISKKAVLRFNAQVPLPKVAADATQLRQVIMNLVINASEAIGDRSGIIAISTGCMQCDRQYLNGTWLDEQLPEGLYVTLEIADTGCGMDKETMARIFDPFFTTKFTGRGLGMAAVLGILRGHKGAIRVYSEVGKGSAFKVLLPASHRPAELLNATEQSDDQDWRGSGTVLLVDDEETVLGIGGEMLALLGFEVLTAANGRQGLEVYRANRDRVVCIILDLTMPHLDGEQTFRELRRIAPEARVIMSSGYNEHEVTQKFVGKGLAGFIQKPYKLSTLRETMRRVLGDNGASA